MMIRWWSDDDHMIIRWWSKHYYKIVIISIFIGGSEIRYFAVWYWSGIFFVGAGDIDQTSIHCLQIAVTKAETLISAQMMIFPKINLRRKSTLIIVNFESLRGAPKSAVLCILPTDSHQFLNIQGWKSSSALKNIITHQLVVWPRCQTD